MKLISVITTLAEGSPFDVARSPTGNEARQMSSAVASRVNQTIFVLDETETPRRCGRAMKVKDHIKLLLSSASRRHLILITNVQFEYVNQYVKHQTCKISLLCFRILFRKSNRMVGSINSKLSSVIPWYFVYIFVGMSRPNQSGALCAGEM